LDKENPRGKKKAKNVWGASRKDGGLFSSSLEDTATEF